MKAAERKAVAEVCRLANSDSLFGWLELPDAVNADQARQALRAARKRLQALQGNPKHGALARAVITHFRKLEGVLAHPEAYLVHLRAERQRKQLPLIDMGVDGVLADGTVTQDELTFLSETAIRLGVKPTVVFRRLRQRAQLRGVSLAPPSVSAIFEAPRHPLLPRGWWGDGMSTWLAAQVPLNARRLVEPVCGSGATALALLPLRPGSTYVGFDEEGTAARAEVALESHHLAGAAMPSGSRSLPLADGSADVVLFVLHDPDPAEWAEAQRIAGPRGGVLLVSPGTPRVTFSGPVPALDGALWGLWRAIRPEPVVTSCQSASTFVVTHTTAGPRGRLVELVEERVDSMQRAGRLADDHPAVMRVREGLRRFEAGGDGVGSYEVPLVARWVGGRSI